MEHTNNTITVRGTLQALPVFSHENHGRRFFRFVLDVARLSGTVDSLPVIAEETLIKELDPFGGDMINVTGQIRSHNQKSDGRRHLMIFIFAASVVVEDGDCINDVILDGVLCKEPVFRRTPLGRDICDIMLAVPRAFHRADYLPCILWGRTAQEISCCHVRDSVHIVGRLQSRIYTKATETGTDERTAYEISALSAEIIPNEPEP